MRGVLLFLAGVLVGANLVYFVMSRRPPAPAEAPVPAMSEIHREPVAVEPLAAPASPDTGLTPELVRVDPKRVVPDVVSPDADIGHGGTEVQTAAPRAAADVAAAGKLKLIVPVRGVTPKQLANTYEDARGSGRVHEAIDIMAERGTPVLAVADGEVEKLFTSDRGGLTIYQFEPSGRYAYYYAHLDRYADDLAEGQALKQGDVVGYVGSTGNASDDAPHLHFGIFELGEERQWWKGTAINPYPVLTGQRRQ
ncbi:M23 family metallopeptidase [Novilysobacter antarcticus]|uniref:M23 family metallopeptidase n=1 Tax=Novilysobacter antarcticus TaxID=2862543 RepID=UPI0031BA6394